VSWLLANTWVALLLATLVLLVGRFVRPAPAVMHVLWLFVLMKLVTPPLFEVPIGFDWSPAATPAVVRVELADLVAVAKGVGTNPAPAPLPTTAPPSPLPAIAWSAVALWL